MTRVRAVSGLTVLEVLIALSVIGVVAAAFTTSTVSTVRYTAASGQRTQAVQLLNYFGRRVAGGDGALLPASGTPSSWDYGALVRAFPDLTDQGGFTDPAGYRVRIDNAGDVAFANASATRYDLTVCFHRDSGESCVDGTTFGPSPSPSAATPPLLPGIN